MIVITTIDILPDHCYQCPCHDGESGYCHADKEHRYSDYRPYWCPLKEILEDVHKPIMRTANIPNWGKGKRRYQDDYGRFTKEGIARYFGDSKEKEKNNDDKGVHFTAYERQDGTGNSGRTSEHVSARKREFS